MVQTDGNGVITVTATAAADLDSAGVQGKTVTLTPQDANGNALSFNGTPQQVGAFKCLGTISATFLPSTCK
jgi:hypothetical protein